MRAKIIRYSAVVALLVGSVAGCSVPSAPGAEFGDAAILASCTPGMKAASDVEVDGSGSSSSDAITADRLAIIADVVRRTAICGNGHLIVRGFSVSSGDTATIYDGDLTLAGATDNARLRKVDKLVKDVMAKITAKYTEALATLPDTGSDITSVYRLAGEYATQLGDKYELHLYVLTDGLNNIGTDLSSQTLSPEQAAQLASTVTVPTLHGAFVTVAGLGRINGDPAPSAFVEGLVAFYTALCQKTGAVSCVSVTEYTSGR